MPVTRSLPCPHPRPQPGGFWPRLAARHGAALLAAGLGGLLFLLIFGAAPLNPSRDSWIFAGYISTDIMQHYAGWLALRGGAWAWPLTFTSWLNWPVGAAASLADCVPLAALAAKALSPVLPATFQYFGLLVLFFMMAMGFAAAKLLALFRLSAAAQVAGSALFSASPVLLERAFQHTALAAQFLVVTALWLYFSARRRGFAKPLWGFVPLAAVAAGIHLYFVPMVLAVAAAALLDGLVATRRAAHLWWFAAAVAAAGATALALGFFTFSEYVPGGYGTFGANLNTFWNPASNNWGVWEPGYQNLQWSTLLPPLPVVQNSLDSFTYLGLGGLGALALAAVFQLGAALQKPRALPRRLAAFAKGHAGLLACCVCLGVFAVSNVVTANSRTLLAVPLPPTLLRLADTFRASGRMLWPVYYLLLLAGCLGCARAAGALARRLAPKAAGRAALALPAAALALVAAVQLGDMAPLLAHKHQQLADPARGAAQMAGPPGWQAIAQPGKALYLLELAEDRPTGLLALKAGMPTNIQLLARGDVAAMQREIDGVRRQLLQGQLPFANAVYLTADAALAADIAAAFGGAVQPQPVGAYWALVLPQSGAAAGP